jgi:hypothetical protein
VKLSNLLTQIPTRAAYSSPNELTSHRKFFRKGLTQEIVYDVYHDFGSESANLQV